MEESEADAPKVVAEVAAAGSTLRRVVSLCLLMASFSLGLFLFWCYQTRADAVTAITLYPVWCWSFLGLTILLASLPSRSRSKPEGAWLRWFRRASLGLWLLFWIVNADTPTSLLKSIMPRPTDGPGTFTVATLNVCSRPQAAFDLGARKPDIMLIQESPSLERMQQITEETYGTGPHLHFGRDASLLSRGVVTPVEVPAKFRSNFVHSRVDLDGQILDVISVRLIPCPVRMDLWSPRCWEFYTKNRKRRRAQFRPLAEYIATLPNDANIIIGGDFNAPAGDAIFRMIDSRLSDAFASAGRGWGASFMNGLPVIRIDQIWTSKQVRPLSVTSHASESDHLWVMALLELAETS